MEGKEGKKFKRMKEHGEDDGLPLISFLGCFLGGLLLLVLEEDFVPGIVFSAPYIFSKHYRSFVYLLLHFAQIPRSNRVIERTTV